MGFKIRRKDLAKKQLNISEMLSPILSFHFACGQAFVEISKIDVKFEGK